MKNNFYITQRGIVYRKGNTIYFQNSEGKRILPINSINAIYCMDRVTIKSGAAYYLMKNRIPVHFFNSFGYYQGSLYPREFLISGKIKVLQVKAYLDNNERMYISKEIVKAIRHNIISFLRKYNKEDKVIGISGSVIDKSKNINELLSWEGKLWDSFYSSYDDILKWNKKFEKRTIRPPKNELNAMISFGNSLLYAVTLTEIYNTYLDPSISFLHEPGERRFSLSLDLSEIFKPLIVSSTITYLVNKRILKSSHFEERLNGIFLTASGKRAFLTLFENKLKTTIKHRTLHRKVSYRRLIRLECYKLIKHLIKDKKYKAFRIWW